MRLALLCDFANLFHSVRPDAPDDPAGAAVRALSRLVGYLTQARTRHLDRPEVRPRRVFLLEDPRFTPAVVGLEREGFAVTVVPRQARDQEDRALRLSAGDDRALQR